MTEVYVCECEVCVFVRCVSESEVSVRVRCVSEIEVCE